MSTSDNKIANKRANDPLDQLIFEEGLRIKQVWFDQSLDLIVVLLNNKKILKRPLSDFERLSNATEEQLLNFENDGIGIFWSEIDEDLSLRGFLKYELAHMDKPLVA
ncbi:DUF2442 domain-containing protein [Tunicatimonas pelagia]|uniref:DUF2442 domain-containing protein n=1 Tax=Tunicatimonas pelagia TaxID=931531 RepID=UPI0026660F60|nr:DUF2442 domain-containing protein [Tunicatimonas pelagia]WKN40835.1 DUF2442 domain-containing protein [Tunicatimonas pelagia]